MPVSSGLLVSFGEKKTHRILEKYSEGFKVFTKVRFFDVIDWNTPNISPNEHSYLERTHFDFVICESKEPLKPLFAVEFDGIGDNAIDLDPYRKLKKTTKSRVCTAEGFTLLWLEFEEIKEIDGVTVLDSILEHYVGGEWIEELIAKGEAAYDDSYASIFRPAAKLLAKYNTYLMGVITLGFTDENDMVEVNRCIRFKTDVGMGKIERSARVRNINFPHFSSLMLAEDLATYHCLNAFHTYVKDGKFILSSGTVKTESFYGVAE